MKRRRLEMLLTTLPEWQPQVLSGEPLRSVRAIQVLERIGTAEAQALLATLSQGWRRWRLKRKRARAALERLERRAPGK